MLTLHSTEQLLTKGVDLVHVYPFMHRETLHV